AIQEAEPPSSKSKTDVFREHYFPDIDDNEWNNWHWQFCNRYVTKDQISEVIQLSQDEKNAMDALKKSGRVAVNITPYYLSLISQTDINQPLRKTVIPTMAELDISESEYEDPLNEDDDSPVPGIVHRYDDRVLMLISNSCSSYCRYCTRSRMIGTPKACPTITQDYIDNAIDYIKNTDCVRDVLLSGGDPLLLPDSTLDCILKRLRDIPHVEIIRIGTKVPVVLPQRITQPLCDMLEKYHPLLMSIHFTHPDELTEECIFACSKLAKAGIPLGSQTVLLSGINDNIETMKLLMHKLLMARVRPYYLYQCDPVIGTKHFRTPVSKGVEIIAGLRGHTTGYAVPTFVIDAPGGGGKVPLQQNYVVASDENQTILRNYAGQIYHYPR
ncbi:MAG: KamA family radical SAM protein, partial [Candidatus Cloacimonetes bacterium]|nr:KamA family radical SAM protein [Candidatus Cloacimonadota bacterium]